MPDTTYLVLESELTSVADAIRTKSGTNEDLTFPNEFISAIENIEEGVNAPDATGVEF